MLQRVIAAVAVFFASALLVSIAVDSLTPGISESFAHLVGRSQDPLPRSTVVMPSGAVASCTTEWSQSDRLFNPYEVAVAGDRLVVRDSDGDAPFLVFDPNGTWKMNVGTWGEGPGEFQRARYGGTLSNGDLLLIDVQRRRAQQMDAETGAYVAEARIPESATSPVPFGDWLIVTPVTSDEAVLAGLPLRLDPLRIDLNAPRPFGEYARLPELIHAKKNYLLKQGPVIAEEDGNLYYALENAGFVSSFAPDLSLRFKTSEPVDVPLPDFVRYDERFTYTSPPRNWYPETFIDLSVDGDRLYALFSGTKVSKDAPGSRYQLDQGTDVFVYDRTSGALLQRIQLPDPVRAIAAHDDALFGLTVDSEVALKRYACASEQ